MELDGDQKPSPQGAEPCQACPRYLSRLGWAPSCLGLGPAGKGICLTGQEPLATGVQKGKSMVLPAEKG